MELPQTALEKLTDALKNLGAQAPTLATKIGILRSLRNEINAAKNEGYAYGVILKTLIENGFKETTVNQFYGLMNRIKLECAAGILEEKITTIFPVPIDVKKPKNKNEVNNENVTETNPLRKLSGSRKPGEFNPVPTAKIEFD